MATTSGNTPPPSDDETNQLLSEPAVFDKILGKRNDNIRVTKNFTPEEFANLWDCASQAMVNKFFVGCGKRTESCSSICRRTSQTQQQFNAAVSESCCLVFGEPRSHDGDVGNNLDTQTTGDESAEDLISPAHLYFRPRGRHSENNFPWNSEHHQN